MKIILWPFVSANEIQWEKRQQRMLSQEEHMMVQRLVLGRILNQKGLDKPFYAFGTGYWAGLDS